MAKINPINGKIRGKIGGLVYANAGGENIVREKAASVSNPNTDAQIETRAKFKLMSQLSAVVRPVLAIKKQGLKSAGNIFVSKNFELASFTDETASVNLNAIQLTTGILALPDFTAERSSGSYIEVALNESAGEALNKVIYAAMLKADDGSLSLLDSKVAEAGQDGDFPANLLYTDKTVVIYAYGMRENTENAKTKFGNINAPSAEKFAKLLTSAAISSSDVTLTKTKGLTLFEGDDEQSSDDVEHFMVILSKSGNGSVSGAGRYVDGQEVTVVATPDSEASFVGWHLNNIGGTIVSTNATYRFTIGGNITLVAEFEGGPVTTYNVQVSTNNSAYGSVSGGGAKQEGTNCTVVATANSGYRFAAWKRNGSTVSTSASYTFTVTEDVTLIAQFEEIPAGDFSNVNFGDSAWNADKQMSNTDTVAISGVNGSQSVNKVGLVSASSAPQAGTMVSMVRYQEPYTPGNTFNFNANNLNAGTYYLVGAMYDDDSSTNTVVDVYEYKVTVQGGDAD